MLALTTRRERRFPAVWSLHNGTPLTADDAMFVIERARMRGANVEARFGTVNKVRNLGGRTSGTKPTALGCRRSFNIGGCFTGASTR